MLEILELVVYKEPYGYIYVTDVAERYDDEVLDAYQISRRYGESLLEIIPLYKEVL